MSDAKKILNEIVILPASRPEVILTICSINSLMNKIKKVEVLDNRNLYFLLFLIVVFLIGRIYFSPSCLLA